MMGAGMAEGQIEKEQNGVGDFTEAPALHAWQPVLSTRKTFLCVILERRGGEGGV